MCERDLRIRFAFELNVRVNEALVRSFETLHLKSSFIIGTNDIQVSYKQIYKELKRRFPGHILAEEDTEWLFMNAGGWMGSMCILYASLTEYILFFGTAIDTSGNSGKFKPESYKVIEAFCK